MEEGLEEVLLGELLGQCNYAIHALNEMQDFLDKRKDEEAPCDSIRFWASVQLFLSAAGNISKILYPIAASSRPRGEHLRKILEVPPDSSFEHTNREIRNCYEHIDTELEQWWRTSPDKRRADYNIMPTAMLEKLVGQGNCFRNYDPKEGLLTFMVHRFDLKPVAKEILGFRLKALALLAQHQKKKLEDAKQSSNEVKSRIKGSG